MSDALHAGQRRLRFVAIAGLFLTASSCVQESAPVGQATSAISNSVKPLNDPGREPAGDISMEAAVPSPPAPAQEGGTQEAPDHGGNGLKLETNQVPRPKEPEETLDRAKEAAMNQPATPAAAPVSSFFPLSDGASWRYELRVLDSDGKTLSEGVVERRVDGRKTIGGKDYFRLTTTTLSGTDTRAPDQHYRVTDDGVVAAVEGVQGKELLVLPNDPGSKRKWSGEAPPIIKRVEAEVTVGEQVACGGSVVKDCVRVDLDFVMRGAGLFGPSEVPVRIERWFASGIGMVRERRIAGGRTIEAVLEGRQL